jgi:hypothetical protein
MEKKKIKQASVRQINKWRTKAEKWDKLEKEIAKFYTNSNGEADEENPENDGDLADLGEIAASAFGWL